MDCWRSGTIRGILKNEKYCGDVLYRKTYTEDYLTHKSVANKDILPQWYWENNHPAIINRKQWDHVQELLVAGRWNHKKKVDAMQKKFTVARVKSGALRGYFLLDLTWTKDERRQFLSLIKSINNLDDGQDDERN